MNLKQYMRSRNKVLNSNNKIAFRFFIGLALIFSVILVCFLFSGSFSIDQVFDFVGSSSVIGAGIIGFASVDDPDNAKKVGKQIKSRFYFIESAQWDDTKTFPARVGREIGNIPLKAGEYWHYIDSVLDSPDIKWSGNMGDVAATISNELNFVLGGMADNVFNLLEKGIGRGFYIVYEICATGEKFIAGNACKPVKMTKFEGVSNKDQTSTTVTFLVECGEVWSKYTGNTPLQAAATIAADATTIGLTSNPQYQLTSGTSAAASITGFTGTTDADINRIVTVLGSGGTHPSTIAATATAFLLIGGETWTAATGKQISFKIFKDGADSYKYVEVAGSRN